VYDFIRFVPRGVAVPPRRRSAAAAVSGILLFVSAPLAAQMPGVPVLQNAFTAPGLVAAVNGGWVDDAKATALAGSWTPGSGRFVLSAGAGVLFPDEGDDVFAWGARLAVPIPRPSTGNFGVGVFVGFGGAEPDVGAVTQLPAGIALGWRRAIGATRALSLYAAPFYNWSRVSLDGETRSAEHVRVSAGLDFAVTPSWGVTVGVETGQEADVDEPGPTGMAVGLGLSYAFGRGR
jgi:hypothetical protein